MLDDQTLMKQPVQRASFLEKYSLFSLSCLLSGIFFFIDLQIPLGVAGGVPHVAAVMLGLWFSSRSQITLITLVGISLTGLGFYLSPVEGEPWKVFANRGLAVFAIAITGTILYIARTKADKFQQLVAEHQKRTERDLHHRDPILAVGSKGLAVILLLFVPIVASLFWAHDLSNNARQWVTHTHEVKITLGTILSTLQDTETGQRGYLLTGEDHYLEPYNWGLGKLPVIFNRLKSLTLDNPTQQNTLKEISPLIDAKLSELDETIQLRKAGNLEAALTVVSTDAGKEFMDKLRVLIQLMISEEARLLEERKSKLQFSEMLTLVISAGSLAMILLVVAFVSYRVRILLNARNLAEIKIKTATESAEKANAELEKQTTELIKEVNARKRIEEELRYAKNDAEESARRAQDSEALNRAIINSAAYSIITTDEQGTIVSFNKNAENLLGYTAAEMIGKQTPALFHDADEVIHRADQLNQELGHSIEPGFESFVALARLGKTDEREWTYIHKDGSRFPVQLAVTGVFNADGTLNGFQGIAQDISERKRTEERLVLADKVFQNAGEAIVVTSADNRIVNVNPAYERITGLSLEEVKGKNPNVARSGRHDADFYRTMWKELSENGTWEGEIWDRRKNGEVYPKWLSITAIKDHQDTITHYVGIFMDVSERKATEEKLEQLAFYDPLTTLPNRALFKDRLIHEIQLAKRDKTLLGLFFIDLDRFKYVNDSLGHDVGDLLLIQVAERLQACLRQSDTVCRLGGDEFTVILSHVQQITDLGQVAESIITRLQEVFHIKEHEVFIGASIGISVYPDNGNDLEQLTKCADMAMYEAKAAGRGAYRYFDESMNEANVKRVSLEADLRRALEHGQIQVYFQPKIMVCEEKIVGMEALVRWIHPEKGVVSPADFIPLAEENGLIIPLGNQVLEQACRWTRTWSEKGLGDLRVAVNLSARQFQDANLIDTVRLTLKETDLPPAQLELEITETAIMSDVDEAITQIRALREMGMHVSIDDFGTGYSSLSYLKKFPLHSLKIDQSFVHDLTEDSEDAAIVRAIISMAEAMNLGVVAEGVETEAQRSFLQAQHCGQAQGYLFSRPLAPDAFEALLVNPSNPPDAGETG
ncbi:MAG: EAL domain-containing protein [Magnetococcales bacterium]|nr:EAL domain-containing protein [Magnetococcales bacterium]